MIRVSGKKRTLWDAENSKKIKLDTQEDGSASEDKSDTTKKKSDASSQPLLGTDFRKRMNAVLATWKPPVKTELLDTPLKKGMRGSSTQVDSKHAQYMKKPEFTKILGCLNSSSEHNISHGEFEDRTDDLNSLNTARELNMSASKEGGIEKCLGNPPQNETPENKEENLKMDNEESYSQESSATVEHSELPLTQNSPGEDLLIKTPPTPPTIKVPPNLVMLSPNDKVDYDSQEYDDEDDTNNDEVKRNIHENDVTNNENDKQNIQEDDDETNSEKNKQIIQEDVTNNEKDKQSIQEDDVTNNENSTQNTHKVTSDIREEETISEENNKKLEEPSASNKNEFEAVTTSTPVPFDDKPGDCYEDDDINRINEGKMEEMDGDENDGQDTKNVEGNILFKESTDENPVKAVSQPSVNLDISHEGSTIVFSPHNTTEYNKIHEPVKEEPSISDCVSQMQDELEDDFQISHSQLETIEKDFNSEVQGFEVQKEEKKYITANNINSTLLIPVKPKINWKKEMIENKKKLQNVVREISHLNAFIIQSSREIWSLNNNARN